MSDSTHLLIPFASSRDEGCAAALAMLALPNLEKLLARLAPGAIDRADEATLSMPHERVLARACGLPAADGVIPWAAWQVAQAGRDPGAHAWAHVTPCHWRVGQDHVAMGHPHDLQLEARESQALLAAMQPYFEGDGIALEYDSPTLWLARGTPSAISPPLRWAGWSAAPSTTGFPARPKPGCCGACSRRCRCCCTPTKSTEQRAQAGLAPVNSFWVSGTGVLPASAKAVTPPGLAVTQALREPALRGDWHGWAAAWQQVDATECADLLRRVAAGQDVTLTLCGDTAAQSWTRPAGPGLLRRIGSLFAGKRAVAQLESL